MSILIFSIVVLIGFIPAVFCLDRLFAINFARAARTRPKSKDTFWRPRGFVGKSTDDAEETSPKPYGEGLLWLVKTPESMADDDSARVLLRTYRLSALLMLAGLTGVAAFLFFF
ncbi:MAG: hypothetical protein OEM82_02035 [Acidobacteriota bacterium]|nr:hypothetical protein [Acidobacteriota bacterium]MDH3530354.1 hypothetical protein [Acidobacteriota bacterium]